MKQVTSLASPKQKLMLPTYADGHAWFADKRLWKTISKIPVTIDPRAMLHQIITYELSQGNTLNISVGTDSQQWGDRLTFATVILVTKEGRGARGIYTQWHLPEMEIFPKILQETQASILCAWGIQGITDAFNLPIQIHLDINPKEGEKSHVAMKECLGYVLGMGYIGVLKPNASTTRAADHLLKSGGFKIYEN